MRFSETGHSEYSFGGSDDSRISAGTERFLREISATILPRFLTFALHFDWDSFGVTISATGKILFFFFVATMFALFPRVIMKYRLLFRRNSKILWFKISLISECVITEPWTVCLWKRCKLFAKKIANEIYLWAGLSENTFNLTKKNSINFKYTIKSLQNSISTEVERAVYISESSCLCFKFWELRLVCLYHVS